MFFLLQVKRKQSGKWSVRAVSRRGAPTAPRLPPSRLTRAQRPGSQRPPGRAAQRLPAAPGPVSARLWLRLGRWGDSAGTRGCGDFGGPRGRARWRLPARLRVWRARLGPAPRGWPPGPGSAQLPCAATARPAGPDGESLGAAGAEPGSAQPRAPCPERWRAGRGGVAAALPPAGRPGAPVRARGDGRAPCPAPWPFAPSPARASGAPTGEQPESSLPGAPLRPRPAGLGAPGPRAPLASCLLQSPAETSPRICG